MSGFTHRFAIGSPNRPNEINRGCSLPDRFAQSNETVKKKAHLVGLCGAGMRSLADYLLARGWAVSGSDQSISRNLQRELAGKTVQVFSGHNENNLALKTDLLIHSLAIPSTNPEIELATRHRIPVYSYVDYLGKLFEQHRGIGVAGTHGKTTTTAILAHLLRYAGKPTSLVFGGRLQGETEFGWCGSSELLVAECCEFRQSFLKYKPAIAILLGIEPDHFDCYPDQKSLLEAFSKFCALVDPQGLLVINGDCELTRKASLNARCPIVSFSVDLENEKKGDWQLKSISIGGKGNHFSVRSPGGDTVSFELPLYGMHQIANAIAAIIVATELGIDNATIRKGIENFPGVERRFEYRGEYRGQIFIDDYAHHPTEIEATIAAARQRYQGCYLTVAFQPHQVLRTESLMEQFAHALSRADRIFVLPVFAAREIEDSRTETVARKLVCRGNSLILSSRTQNRRFEYSASLDHLRSSLDDSPIPTGTSSPNLFLTLGAGNIDRIYHELPGFIR